MQMYLQMSHGRNDPSTSFSLSGKQDYKKTKPALRATRLKAEAKRSAPGIRVRWLSFILITSPSIPTDPSLPHLPNHTHTHIIHHTSPTWEQLKQSPYWWGREELFDSQRSSSLSPLPSPLLSLDFSFSLSCHSRIIIESLRKKLFYSPSLCDFHVLMALAWSSITVTAARTGVNFGA